jgi:hypothetical protein
MHAGPIFGLQNDVSSTIAILPIRHTLPIHPSRGQFILAPLLLVSGLVAEVTRSTVRRDRITVLDVNANQSAIRSIMIAGAIPPNAHMVIRA